MGWLFHVDRIVYPCFALLVSLHGEITLLRVS